MAGHTGADRVTTRNLKVLRVDADNHLLILEGAVPGGPNGHVMIRKAVAAKPEPKPQAEKAPKGKAAGRGRNSYQARSARLQALSGSSPEPDRRSPEPGAERDSP